MARKKDQDVRPSGDLHHNDPLSPGETPRTHPASGPGRATDADPAATRSAIQPTPDDILDPQEEQEDANRDPITGAPGSHPIGTGIGAAAAGAAGTWAGAAIGAAASGPAAPVGGAVGAVVGAVVGGLAGKGVGEAINPTDETAEEAYWREHYASRSYVQPGSDYADYGPAYRYGWRSSCRYPDRSFDEAEQELARDWDRSRGQSKLSWDRARSAVRDAWDRMNTRGGGPQDADDYDRPANRP
jgi:hypothetical protein